MTENLNLTNYSINWDPGKALPDLPFLPRPMWYKQSKCIQCSFKHTAGSLQPAPHLTHASNSIAPHLPLGLRTEVLTKHRFNTMTDRYIGIYIYIYIYIYNLIYTIVVVKIRSFFKISQWNLVGKWAMGPIAHIIIYAIIWHAVIDIWQKMREKKDKWMYKLWSPRKRWAKFIPTMILGSVP